MAESTQKKLKRVRKPRVHITYVVEIGDSREKVELPFVAGIMGDFSGDPTKPLDPLSNRKFTQISRDNFDDVMGTMNAGLNMRVENTLDGDGSEMAVQLEFNSIADFDPAKVAQQIEPLRKLISTRDQLRDLMAKIDRSQNLEGILDKVLQDESALSSLAAELGLDGESGDS